MLTFPAKDIVETIDINIPFTTMLPSDGVISSAVVDVAVWAATGGAWDANPTAIATTPPELLGSTVKQRVVGGVAGVTYLITATSTTTKGIVRVQRGTLVTTGLIVPSAVPPALTIVPFSGIEVGTIKYQGVMIAATVAEINYLVGVTSGIQAQIDLKAQIANPTFTGIPAAPTAAVATNTTQLATTAFVQSQISVSAPGLSPVQSVAGRIGIVVLTKSDVGLANVDNTTDLLKVISTATQAALDLKAPINNPTFTGTIGGITKAMVGLGNADNTTDAAKPISTATQTALNLKAPVDNPSFTTRVTTPAITLGATAITATGTEINYLSGVTSAIQTALNLKAPLATPTFTGLATASGGLAVTGNATITGNVLPEATSTRDIGTSANRFRFGFFGMKVDVTGALGTGQGIYVAGTGATDRAHVYLAAGDGTTSNRMALVSLSAFETAPQRWDLGMLGAKAFVVQDATGSRTPLSISNTDGLVTLANGITGASNVLEVRNGTAAQSIRISNTVSGVDHERVLVGWSGNAFFISGEQGGTGVSRNMYFGTGGAGDIYFRTGGVNRWYVPGATGHLAPGLTNTYDLGSAALRVRYGYFGTGIQVAGALGANSAVNIQGTGATDRASLLLQAGDGTTSNRYAYLRQWAYETASQYYDVGMLGTKDWKVLDGTSARTPISVSATDGLVTLANGANVTGGGGLQVGGAQIQRFTLQFRNNGGVIEHRIAADVSTLGNPSSANRITGATNTWTATPTLSASVGFAAGVGLNAGIGDQYVLFDVAAQGYFDIIPIAVISGKAAGITTNYIPAVTGTTQNVNGVSRYRTTIVFSAPINTTNIPSTNILSIDLIGFIK